jgi:hypothetical protein
MSGPFSQEVVISNTPLPVDGSGVTQPVSGAVSVTNFPATQPVSGTVTVANPGLTDTQLRASPVPVSSTPHTSNAATVAQIALVANTSTLLLAANANRVGMIVFVPTQPAYIKFGATASSTSFTYKVTANNSSVPMDPNYTGLVHILAGNAQSVTVTEY